MGEPDCNFAGNVVPLDGHVPVRRLDGDGSVDGLIVAALDRLDERRQRVRDPQTGRWTTANGGRLVTAHRSDLFWHDLEPARAAIEARVIVQLGLDADDAPETALGLVSLYAEARVQRRTEFIQLTRTADTRATTPKARSRVKDERREYRAGWAIAADREIRLATLLGLERKPRHVTFADAIRAATAAHAEDGDAD